MQANKAKQKMEELACQIVLLWLPDRGMFSGCILEADFLKVYTAVYKVVD